MIDRPLPLDSRWQGYFLICLLFAVAGFFLLPQRVAIDPDLFYLLAHARLTDALGHLPIADPFSFQPTKAVWIEHQWFSARLIQLPVLLFGDRGILGLKLASTILAFAFLRSTQRSLLPRSGNGAFAILLFCFLLTPAWYTNIRGSAFSLVCFSMLLWLFVQRIKTRSTVPLIIAPFLFAIWTNLHAEVLIGFSFWSIFLFVDVLHYPSTKNLLVSMLSLLVSSAALLANPWGIHLFTDYLFQTALLCAQGQHQAECRGATSEPATFLLMTMSSVLAGMTFYKHRKSLRSPVLLLPLGAALLLGLRLARLQHYWLFLFPTLGLYLLNQAPFTLFKPFSERYRLLWDKVIIAILLSGIMLLLTSWKQVKKSEIFSFCGYPVATAEWLLTHVDRPEKIISHFNYGNYLLWRLYPQFRVSFDGRYVNVYPPESVHRGFLMGNPPTSESAYLFHDFDPGFALYFESEITNKSTAKLAALGFTECFRERQFRLFCNSSQMVSSRPPQSAAFSADKSNSCPRPPWTAHFNS